MTRPVKCSIFSSHRIPSSLQRTQHQYHVVINLEDTDLHQIPLPKVSSDKKEIFTHSDNNGFKLQVDEITEEKILPVGNVITAVGIFSLENGVPNIKPYKGLPYFLTTKSKRELVAELSAKLENATDWSDYCSDELAGFALGVLIAGITLWHQVFKVNRGFCMLDSNHIPSTEYIMKGQF